MQSRRTFLLGAGGSVLGLLACDPGSDACIPPAIKGADGACVDYSKVRLNSLGFLPDRAKRASILGAPSGAFVVRRPDGSSALSGTAMGPVHNTDTSEDLWIADFTALTETGTFYVEAPGVGRSPSFRVAPDLYQTALSTAILGLTGQRCGATVTVHANGLTFTHPDCHLDDAHLDYLGKPGRKPSLGGWHDAGDYGKYTINGAFAAAIVLKAWEHFGAKLAGLSLQVPEHGGLIPDLLAEVKWELDWLLTVQAVDGSVSHKVTALAFEALSTPPEGDLQTRYFAPSGTAAAADFTAVMAQAGRVYAPYDAAFAATCLAAAQLSYAYLLANPSNQQPDLSAFSTGAYQTSDNDDRRWAAAEIWESTGDSAALADFESRISAGTPVQIEWDWGDVGNLGLFTYALSKRDGRTDKLAMGIQNAVIAAADNIVTTAGKHGYARGVGTMYYWGINGTVVRTTMTLMVAQKLGPKDAYLDTAVAQVDHLFGRNVYGRSMVTGMGYSPPVSPHHRPSITSGGPWPGLVVGGPWPMATSWVDDSNTYQTNEVAINWAAPLVYALAAFVPESA